jgi:hypothetical protein
MAIEHGGGFKPQEQQVVTPPTGQSLAAEYGTGGIAGIQEGVAPRGEVPHAQGFHRHGPGTPRYDDPAFEGRGQDDATDEGRTSRRRIVVTKEDRDEYRRNINDGYFSHQEVHREITDEVSAAAIEFSITYEEGFVGTGEKPYKWYDSPLELPGGFYPRASDQYTLMHEHNIYPYAFDFQAFAPPGQTLKEYIQTTVPEGAVGVDIGGPGSTLFRGFDRGTFSKTVGMTLVDLRDEETKAADAARGHDILPGPFQENWEALDSELEGEKAHVIFSRLGGGGLSLPQDPYQIHEQLDNAYQRLSSEGGRLITTVPRIMRALAEPWAEKVTDGYQGQIGVSIVPTISSMAIQIEKREDAPEHLPGLSSREVRELYRRAFPGRR